MLEKQVEEAKNLGISGFVVNWYGPNHAFEDRSYSLLQDVASQSAFTVAIMYDENSDDPGHTTEVDRDASGATKAWVPCGSGLEAGAWDMVGYRYARIGN